ncbi:GNAT family N-acetyltransferase [Neobacillus sp. DY30]|uniref:GNAT family N-acetyltransferase n=1 Tax=Neobacillus sp. DY30 TaxID=3047871 RepID=UPI0024BF3BD5|nr:GNAT family N-acetyltransferase [Neobacillus sp. DY30]WHY01202.1 GNAT family N-acetyltransferase [Neobacillus sp. DY30]
MKWIYEGILRNGNIPFKVRKLAVEDLIEILEVQKQVIQAMEAPGILQPLTKDEYQYILEGKGLMIGAFAGTKLIAFRALLIPPMDEDHLGRDIGLPEHELPKVLYQEISNVLPKFRGNNLQKTLAALIMDELGRENQQFRYICCTVAPFNIPSLKDKFAQGMQIAALKEKYGGSLRYIFVKDLKETEEQTVSFRESLTINMDDIEAQQKLIEQGWRGIKMEEAGGTYWVYYSHT